MTLAVYTCIVGPIKDRLRPVPVFPNVEMVAFTDQTTPAAGWTLRPLEGPAELPPRRRARFHKLNSHLVLPGHDAWLWLDGSFQLRDSPADFLSHFSGDMELGCFAHSERKCVYAEYRSCIRLRKDDETLMTAQIGAYRNQQYPENNGLTETGILYRKNCASVCEFNQFWWNEVSAGSHRDQLSFNYCLWKIPLKTVQFPGNVYTNALTTFHRHR